MSIGHEVRDGALIVNVALAEPQTPICTCSDPKVRKHGKRTVEFRDHPIQRQPVFLSIVRQRYRCENCKSILLEDLPGIDTNRLMTVRFRDQLAQDSIARTFHDAAEVNGVKESLARRIFASYAEKRLKDYTFDLPRVLGMDEVHIQGAPRFVVGDVTTKRMLDMQQSRAKLDLVNYFHAMGGGWGNVEVVTQDMYWGYKTINEQFFKRAVIVIDKFHVVRYANLAVENVRKAVQAGLDNEGRISMKRKAKLLAARPANLSDDGREALDRLLSGFPALQTAVTLKEWFYDIYRCQTRAEAEAAYKAWLELVPDDMEKFFKPVMGFMRNKRWRTLVFNYFEHPYTNAYVEALNGLIRQIDRAGRGYDLSILRAKALLRYGNVKPLDEVVDFRLTPETADDVMGITFGHGIDVSTFESAVGAEAFW